MRAAVWALAVLVAVVAVAVAAVAIDVLRTPGELARDDGRFQTDPVEHAGLWDVGFVPRDASERLLGLGDDVSYRRLAGLYLEVEPGKVDVEAAPELESTRSELQDELTSSTEDEVDPLRRSRLLTMYGVMALQGEAPDEDARREALAAFRTAIDLDPTNADAMTNLEALLNRFGAEGEG
jgi:hypothetical protein